MTTKPKKKRFEGLIHFKDYLRQTIVCLQASLLNRFATSLQSELISSLDDQQSGVHFLLFSSSQQIGKIIDKSEIEPHHVLSRLQQISSPNFAEEVVWHGYEKTKISVWLDPLDHFAAFNFYQIVMQVCNQAQTLDLKTCHNWGSHFQSHPFKSQSKAREWLASWLTQFQIGKKRAEQLTANLNRSLTLFTQVDNLCLTSDGTYVSLIIEGQFAVKKNIDLNKVIPKVAELVADSLVLNLNQRDQISMTLSLLNYEKSVALKSFALVKDLEKDAAKIQSKQRAS